MTPCGPGCLSILSVLARLEPSVAFTPSLLLSFDPCPHLPVDPPPPPLVPPLDGVGANALALSSPFALSLSSVAFPSIVVTLTHKTLSSKVGVAIAFTFL
jgi:hypothetical protein